MKCPLCKKNTENILTNKLRKGEDIDVFYCGDCGLGFLNDTRTEDEIKEYYAKQYRREYKPKIKASSDAKDLFDNYAPFQHERLRLIAPFLGKNKKLLEIGCSAGMFLYNVKNKVKEAVGMDFDVSSAAFAQKKCGCKVYTKKLEDTPLKKKYFDVICAFQVLEHVKEPLKFLLEVKEYLKDDGVLFVEVPNLRDILVSTYDLPFHHGFYFHAAHALYFTKKSLQKLMRKAGFSGSYHFTQDYNIINHFNWVINDRPQESCFPGLSAPNFPLRKSVKGREKSALNGFLNRIDKEYKELISDLGLSSNLAFVGKKEKKDV
ncbi:MAG: class I SAM-dependent methyltransferase [Candidatus Margulisiibacteriota bacterium]